MNHSTLNKAAFLALAVIANALLLSASAKAQAAGVNVYFDPNDTHTTTAGGSGDFSTSDFYNPSTSTDGPFVSGTNGVGTFTAGEGAIFNGPASTVTVSAAVSPDYLEIGVTSGTETFGTSGSNASEISLPVGLANSPGDGQNTATVPVTSNFTNTINIDAGSENVVFNSGLNFAEFNRYYNVGQTAPTYNFNNPSLYTASTGNVAFNGGITFTNNVSAATTDDINQGTGEPDLGLSGVAGSTFTINSAVTQVNSTNATSLGNAPYVALWSDNTTLTLTKNASFNGVIVEAGAGTVLDQGASYTTAPNFNTQGIVVGGAGQFLTDTAGMTVASGVQFVNVGEYVDNVFVSFGGGTVGSALAAETTYSGTVVGYSGLPMNLTSAAGGRVDFTGDVVNGNGFGIIKVGAGTINLNNANPGSENQGGAWEVKNGTMLLNGTVANNTAITGSGLEIDNVATASLVPNVQTYATLGGNGSTGVLVTADGANSSITPGDPTVNSGIGTLGLSGGLTANNGLTLNFTLNGANPNSEINMGNGTLTLSGVVTFNFTNIGGALSTSTPYILIYSAPFAPAFHDLTAILVANGPAGYTASIGPDVIGQEQVIDVTFSAVPEPSTYVMMLGGLALLGFCVRRKLA